MKHPSTQLARLLLVVIAVAGSMLEVSCQDSERGPKLCGRDFVRTVLVACGGARWRRHSPEENYMRDSFYNLLDEVPLSWSTEKTKRDVSEPATPTEVREALRVVGQRDRTESSEDWEEEHGTRLSSAFQIPLGQPLRFRHRRGIAKICCSQGCTRREILDLC